MLLLTHTLPSRKRGQIYERNVRHAHLFLGRHFGSRTTVIPSPRGPDLSFSRWRRYYKSRGSFPVYLASEVQKQSNAPVPGQKLATKVSKSRAIPPYVPGVNPTGWPLISVLSLATPVAQYKMQTADCRLGEKRRLRIYNNMSSKNILSVTQSLFRGYILCSLASL